LKTETAVKVTAIVRCIAAESNPLMAEFHNSAPTRFMLIEIDVSCQVWSK